MNELITLLTYSSVSDKRAEDWCAEGNFLKFEVGGQNKEIKILLSLAPILKLY